LEFSVDPLFRKTCADFDEGGASGLLLNHLHVYGGGRIVFDASDVDVAAKVQPVNQQELDELNGTVDMSQLLQSTPYFLLSYYGICLNLAIAAYGPVIPNLEDLVICPTLRGFSFSSASRLLESWRTGKEITEAEELEDAPPPELDFSSDHENDVVAFGTQLV
jgi:condensin complex subunit 2